MNGERSAFLRLIQDEAHDSVLNMAVDEFLLKKQIQTKDSGAVLRFYRFNKPAVTVGYGMWKTVQAKMKPQIPFVRRITGGGMVAHEKSDLTYSLIVSLNSGSVLRKVRESYFLIHDELRKTFDHFGIKTELFAKDCKAASPDSRCKREQISYCFDAPVLFDVILSGKKIAGAGQKRTQGYLLHQGSIAWNALTKIGPSVSESEFSDQFSSRIGNLLALTVKRAPLYAEEMQELVSFV